LESRARARARPGGAGATRAGSMHEVVGPCEVVGPSTVTERALLQDWWELSPGVASRGGARRLQDSHRVGTEPRSGRSDGGALLLVSWAESDRVFRSPWPRPGPLTGPVAARARRGVTPAGPQVRPAGECRRIGTSLCGGRGPGWKGVRVSRVSHVCTDDSDLPVVHTYGQRGPVATVVGRLAARHGLRRISRAWRPLALPGLCLGHLLVADLMLDRAGCAGSFHDSESARADVTVSIRVGVRVRHRDPGACGRLHAVECHREPPVS
jgi:hypothetical protein